VITSFILLSNERLLTFFLHPLSWSIILFFVEFSVDFYPKHERLLCTEELINLERCQKWQLKSKAMYLTCSDLHQKWLLYRRWTIDAYLTLSKSYKGAKQSIMNQML